jgi:ribonuclease HI
MYTINCINTFSNKWETNNWKTSSGTSVEWSDTIRYIRMLITNRRSKGADTVLRYVKGHSGDAGNTEADTLARTAAETGATSNVVLFLEEKCRVPMR